MHQGRAWLKPSPHSEYPICQLHEQSTSFALLMLEVGPLADHVNAPARKMAGRFRPLTPLTYNNSVTNLPASREAGWTCNSFLRDSIWTFSTWRSFHIILYARSDSCNLLAFFNILTRVFCWHSITIVDQPSEPFNLTIRSFAWSSRRNFHIMALSFTLVTLLTAQSIASSPLQRRQNPPGLSFNWGSEVIRGVNIGGWLILEPWVKFLNINSS